MSVQKPKVQSIQPGQILADRYVIVSLVGEGGMGVVFEGKHMRLGTRVAIKTLLDEVANDDEVRYRFDREARAAAQLKSKHSVQVIDVDEMADGRPFMVMEFLEGYDLEEVVQSGSGTDVRESVDYILQACSAMVEAHGAGIVHRDLKPSNLFCALNDGKACLKVLDFGISKIRLPGEAKDVTQTTTVFGTPTYMSPEQIQSAKSVDERADVWSLGVILYELLTGRVPFRGDNAGAIIWAICSETAPPPSLLRPDMPEALSLVVMKALEKDREQRFNDMEELAEALLPFGSPEAWEPPDPSLVPIERRASHRGVKTLSEMQTVALMPEPPSTQGAWTTSRRLSVRRTQTALVAGGVVLLAVAAGLVLMQPDREVVAPMSPPPPEPASTNKAWTEEPVATTTVSAPRAPVTFSQPLEQPSAEKRNPETPSPPRPTRPSAEPAVPSPPTPAPSVSVKKKDPVTL